MAQGQTFLKWGGGGGGGWHFAKLCDAFEEKLFFSATMIL